MCDNMFCQNNTTSNDLKLSVIAVKQIVYWVFLLCVIIKGRLDATARARRGTPLATRMENMF